MQPKDFAPLAVSATICLCLSPQMYWTNSYWGGSVAASGGASVLLAIGLYRARPSVLAGITFAIGVALLFWTRPYEGGVFTLAVLIVFAGDLKDLWSKQSRPVLAATILVLVVGATWSGYYNRAITGNPFQLPYLLHEEQYSVTPIFWFLPMRPEPSYSYPRLAALHGKNGSEASAYAPNVPEWARFFTALMRAALTLGGWLLATALLMLLTPVARRDPLAKKIGAIALVFFAGLVLSVFHFEHYAAPVWAAFAILLAIWAQQAWKLRFRGLPLGIAVVIVSLALPVVASLAGHADSEMGVLPGRSRREISSRPYWADRRVALIKHLSALDRGALVIVRYPAPDWLSMTSGCTTAQISIGSA